MIMALALVSHAAASSPGGIAKWFFFGLLVLAAAGLATLFFGMTKMKREQLGIDRGADPNSKISVPQWTGFARGRWRRVTINLNETLSARDVIPGIKARNPRVIAFTLCAGGLAVFVLSTFLAIGTGMLAYDASDDGGGWVFIGFVVLFASVVGHQVFKAASDKTQ